MLPVRQIHIRLATWDDDPPDGGQGVVVRGQRAALEARGLRLSTTAGRGRFAVPYRRLSGHGPLDMSISLNISWRKLLEGDPDIVYVSGGPGGLQLIRKLPMPMVYLAHHTFRQSHPRYHAQRAYGLAEAHGYRLARHVVAVSQSTADSIMEMRVPSSRITVISPGVDSAALMPAATSRRVPGRMIFVGRLKTEKGVLEAIAVMSRVLAEVPDASGVIIGAGPLASEVRAAVAAEAGGRIVYRGELSDREVAEELWKAEVAIVPSQFEGLGLVALEAMAAGVAVVGYDVAGLHESIGTLGRLVPFGDQEGLVKQCRMLLEDETGRYETVAAASNSVTRDRSWSANAAALEEVFRDVLSSG